VFGSREILKEVAPKIREFAWEELGLIVNFIFNLPTMESSLSDLLSCREEFMQEIG
jgi:hypothetical protein